MKEPLRLRDDPSSPEEMRSLLRAAPVPRRMSSSERARTSKRVAAIAALPIATASFFTLKGAALAAVALGTGVLAASSLTGPWFAEAPAQTEPSLPSAAVIAPPAPAPPHAEQAEAEPVASATEPPVAPALSDSQTKSAAAPSNAPAKAAAAASVPPREDTLRAEAALLERARSLSASNPSAALTLLDQHAAEFPKGKLSIERELIAVDALRRAGRASEARARGEALLQRTRGGLYEERVRALLQNMP